MKYKEFKKEIEEWGIKYDYATRVIFEDFNTYIEVGTGNDAFIVAHVSNIYMFTLETRWNYSTKITNHARGELFDILVDLAKTPIEEREDNKTLDSIINRLEVIQTNAEDVMNWTIEEIRERSWNLRNNLDDIIIDLEKVKDSLNKKPSNYAEDIKNG